MNIRPHFLLASVMCVSVLSGGAIAQSATDENSSIIVCGEKRAPGSGPPPRDDHCAAFFLVDNEHPITLKGSVTEFKWINPLASLTLLGTDSQGKQKEWKITIARPQVLAKLGWTKDALKNGSAITVVIAPARSGENIGLLKQVALADGRKLEAPTVRDLRRAQ